MVAGSFFDPLPVTAVPHNWSDDDAVRILRQSPSKPDPSAGGRERTYGQWQELAIAAGMRVESVSNAL
ncbi:hypothetical protein ACWD0G_29275, partial [Streptomyces goshikiensis]